MCPDHDLISAYVDGEVPSPWRERLDEHIAVCPDCTALVSSYARLGERLRAEFVIDEAEPLARGRSRLDALLEALPAKDASPRVRDGSWKVWRRSVSLPLPLAAAAAALVILLSGATTLLALRPSKAASIQTVASSEIAPPQAMPSSMNELLRYLDARDGQVTLTINLPSEATFGNAGKPVIMRSTELVGAKPIRGSSP
jgi:anti-sigma factor RsiW